MVRNFVYPAPYAALDTDTPAQAQGKRIRYWRKKKDSISQKALARLVGCEATTISTLERGAQYDSASLVQIAAALGVSYDHLHTGRGDPHEDVAVVHLISDEASLFPPEITRALEELEPAEKRLAAYRLKEVIDEIKALRRTRKQG